MEMNFEDSEEIKEPLENELSVEEKHDFTSP